MKIAFIGGGTMGEAILAALLEKKRIIPSSVCISDVSKERRDYISGRYGVLVTDDNKKATEGKDVIVLAIKPQQFGDVLSDLKGSLLSSQVVISIAAGIRIQTMTRGLGHSRVVRAMPNTPAQIGQGITGWTATPGVTDLQKEHTRTVLTAMGKEIYFQKEESLDMVTAISGSGPAYFFFFAEALTAAAVNIGLSPEDAGELILQTMLGAARLLEKSAKPPAELRRNVTSKSGTTERAIQVFEAGGFNHIVDAAVKAALERAKELGG
ncbi:MAG: pyrroline-5-carboxylate reductase [Chloroflexi bacterium RBG_16_56_11]|nr:MAG: pyrroline-5-carboxylate reductase [Chloroflexi bacterium RBG_16_56_11]